MSWMEWLQFAGIAWAILGQLQISKEIKQLEKYLLANVDRVAMHAQDASASLAAQVDNEFVRKPGSKGSLSSWDTCR